GVSWRLRSSSSSATTATLVGLVLERTLQGLPPLLSSLSRLALSLDRRFLVVLAPLHLLKQAVLQHLLLELLQRGFDLVVEDLDLHLGHPEVSRRSMRLVRHGGVDDVHRREPLRSFLDGAGDRLKGIARLLDELTGVVDDAPSPEWILRGGERQDLHLRLPPTPVESPADAELLGHSTPLIKDLPRLQTPPRYAEDGARDVV